LELARRVRARGKQPRVYLIALTGYGQKTDRMLALEAGFDEHVVKPVDLAALRRLLDAHCRPAAELRSSDTDGASLARSV
jgi:DNA-binding response OmpR family regulator